MQEPLAAQKEAREERDDPGTEADDGIGNGNPLDSCQCRIIRNEVVGITPLVAVDRTGIAEEPKRRGVWDGAIAVGVKELTAPFRILGED